MASSNVLTLDRLTKIFGTYVAVNELTFSVKAGEIIGMLGANGAGKTTTLQMLLNTLTPTSGSIYYFGKDFVTYRPEILQQLSFASTYCKMPWNLSLWNNLDIHGQIYGMSSFERSQKIAYWLKRFDLWEHRTKLLGMLSAGQITRAMLAKAFLTSPKIVLLDEPTASLDIDVSQDVLQCILEQRAEHGTSFLITSHDMEEVAYTCDRVLVLQRGVLIAQDTPQNLARSIATDMLIINVHAEFNKAVQHLQEHGHQFIISGNCLEISCEEKKIPALLINLARIGVDYDNLHINKPTLQDYFVHLAKGKLV